MKSKIFSFLVLLICSVGLVGLSSATSDIYVNETGWWYAGETFNASDTPIQHAVNNAISGNSIYIWNGSYSDNIIISTNNLTIQGESRDTVEIVAKTNSSHVIKVDDNTDYVSISNLNVSGADANQMTGIIYRPGADYGNVTSIITLNNYYGIHLQNSSNTVIKNCISRNNSLHGILMNTVTNYNKIINNTIQFNNYYGISLYSSNHAIVENNTVYKSNQAGIHIDAGINNTIENNDISETTEDGIYLNGGNNNIVENNTIYDNGRYGIHPKNSDYTTIYKNNITTNSLSGILLETSNNCNLTDNTISESTRYGVYVYNSDDTFVYNNHVNDTGGGYYDYYLNPTSYRTVFKNLADMHNYISIGDAVSNCTVEFTDRTIFEVDDASKHVEYYTDSSNLSLQDASIYRIDKYNGTLTPYTTFLQNVSVNTWSEAGYNITVNSSNATEICTFTANVANASDNYGCYVDGVLVQTIQAVDGVVSWEYLSGFSVHDLNIKWDSIYVQPPQNVTTVPHQTSVDIDWDDYASADKYSVYEMEDGFLYVTTNPIIDGIKDAIYNYSHEFLIFSPNPVNPGDYETIYPLRTSLGAYFLIESVDNDNKLGDDDAIYYFDLDNDGLTIDDPAWKITNNIVKKYLWNGGSWQVTGVSDAVGASTGGGTHYPKHELFIPIAELGANWTNGSTVKVLVKREDSSLTPDVITWYPFGNINNTDTSLWQEMVLNQPNIYNLLANVTLSNYTATNLTPFTIYHGAVSAWNGSHESSYTLFDVITEDIPVYNVSGYVFDDLGNTIAGAVVHSCNAFVHEITQTDIYGYWIGYNFREGNYTICANKSGYADNYTNIYVSTNLTNINVTLTAFEMTDWMLWEKLLEIEDLVTPNSTVPETTPPENAMPLPLFITWIVIMFVMLGISVPKHDDYDNLNIGIPHILFGLIATTIAYVLSKQIINGQVVQTFSGISQINTVVITTQSVQISWLSYVLQFIGIAAFILTMILILAFINEHFMKEIEDEEVV